MTPHSHPALYHTGVRGDGCLFISGYHGQHCNILQKENQNMGRRKENLERGEVSVSLLYAIENVKQEEEEDEGEADEEANWSS